jgi:hypothetical protein
MDCQECGAHLRTETVIPIPMPDGSIDLTFSLHVECAELRGLFQDEERERMAEEIQSWSDELRDV